uniref:DNA ligase (ATP) n=1 Tax=Ammonifex degensii TaxID=42838 RepID=A0A7C2E355_9THEO
MLAVNAQPFSDPAYLFEVKWDGYRCLAYLEENRTLLRSRNLRNLTPAFPELETLHLQVNALPAILDGEIVVFKDGRPDFGALQARGRLFDRQRVTSAARSDPAVFVVFDLLYRGGEPVLKDLLERRRKFLKEIVKPGPHIIVAEYFLEEGELFFAACRAKGLEGVMGKRRDSPYVPGQRSPFWKKVRAWKSADLVICGWEANGGVRGLGALILGGYQDERLVFAGKVGTGFDAKTARELVTPLERLSRDRPPLDLPPAYRRGKSRWVEPSLVCTVEFTEVTRDGYLRHPVYRGLRRDKEPRECVWPAV